MTPGNETSSESGSASNPSGRVTRSMAAGGQEAQGQASEPRPATSADGQIIPMTLEALNALFDRATRSQPAQNEEDRSEKTGPTLRTCNGEQLQNARRWLTHFKTCAEVGEWSEKRKCGKFSTAMEDQALDWFASLPEAIRRSWPALENAFCERFCPMSAQAAANSAYDELRQGPTEDVGQFAQRFLELIVRSGNEMMSEYKKVNEFLGKLRPEIRAILNTSQPLSLEENINRAIHTEIRIKAEQRGSNNQAPANVYYPSPPSLSSLPSPPSLSSRDDATVASLRRRYTCEFCKRTGHSVQQCYRLQEVLGRTGHIISPGTQEPPVYNPRSRGRGRGQGRRDARGRGGHVNAQHAEMQGPMAAQALPPTTTTAARAPVPESWKVDDWPACSLDDETGTYKSATTNPFAQPLSKN
jgi:hypothetical protein